MTEQAERIDRMEQETDIAADDAATRLTLNIAGQLTSAMGLSRYPAPQADANLLAAMEAVADIAPRNALEGMLTTQMVATQNLVLSCLGNAATTDNTRVLETALAAGVKLMRLFAQQVDTLHRLRGKQRSTMRVEHVQLAPDGETKLTGQVERVR